MDRKVQLGVVIICIIAVLGVGLYALRGEPVGWEGKPLRWIHAVYDQYDIREAYYDRSAWVEEGIAPYQDADVEYPLVALLYMSIPRLFTDSLDGYVATLLVFNMIVFGVATVLLAYLLRLFQKPINRLVILLFPTVIFFALSRFDLLVVVFMLAALYALYKKQLGVSLVLLFVASLTKIFPLLFVPIFLWYASQHMSISRRVLYGYATAFGLLFIGLHVVLLLVSGWSALMPYIFQFGRSIEPGSFAYTLEQGIRWIFPSFADRIGSIIKILLLGFQAFFLWRIGHKTWIAYRQQKLGRENVLRAVIVVILVLVAGSSFYSPQWMLWWLPLMAVLSITVKEWWVVLAASTANYLLFPILFFTIGPFSIWYQIPVALVWGGMVFIIGAWTPHTERTRI